MSEILVADLPIDDGVEAQNPLGDASAAEVQSSCLIGRVDDGKIHLDGIVADIGAGLDHVVRSGGLVVLQSVPDALQELASKDIRARNLRVAVVVAVIDVRDIEGVEGRDRFIKGERHVAWSLVVWLKLGVCGGGSKREVASKVEEYDPVT